MALVQGQVRTLAIALACAMACSTTGAYAQTVTDPQVLEFDPSPDHFVVTVTGTPLVDHYELEIFEMGVPVPYDVVSIGKPAPQSDGKIRLSFMPLLTKAPLPQITYQAQINTVGPTGSSPSTWSNDFVFSTSCSYLATASSTSFGAAGGSGTIGVTTSTGCVWSAVSTAAWLTLGATGGTGSGHFAFSVAPNPTTSSRSAVITVESTAITITQTASSSSSCTYTISANSTIFPSTGGSGSISITAPAGCAWTPVSSAAWLTVGGGGSGSGTVRFTVGPNPSTSSRSATITVGGQSVAVTQKAGDTACSYALTASSTSFPPSGGSGTITVTAPSGCAWTPASSAPWLTLGAAGSGSGTLQFVVASNPLSTSRSATVTVGNKSLLVNQMGVGCATSVSLSSTVFPAAGGSGTVNVIAPGGCGWTAVSSAFWLVMGAGRTGTGSVSFTVAVNPSSLSRSASIQVAGRTFTVTQSGATCTVSIASSTQSFAASGGSGTVNVAAPEGCDWAASSNAEWLKSGIRGSGNGSVGFTVAANGSTTSRSGLLTVANRSLTVTESGIACIVSLSTNSASFPASGGSGTVSVSVVGGCGWKSVSSAAWLVPVILSGSGSGTLAYTVAANTSSRARSATLSVGGALFQVDQAGRPEGRNK